jgi:hypothetical protein
MRDAVGLVSKMRAQVPLGQSIPGVLAPKSSGSSAAAKPEEMPEVLQAHCIHCHREGRAEPGKSTMRVEGEQKMPNGAIRKYGTCTHAQCGGKMSTLVSGKAKVAA